MNSLGKCRRRAFLTQEQVAAALGLKSSSTLSMIETDRNQPTAKMLVRLAKLYGCSTDDLLETLREKLDA